MKIYGYARVSTQKQNIDRQVSNITGQYPDAIMIQDKWTGTEMNRPNWIKLEKKLQPGDTVVFDEVSRMSRDADEGFSVYQELFNRGVNLVFLKEPHINTDVYRKAGEKQIEINLESGSEPIDKFGNGMITLVNELLLDLAKEQIRLAFAAAEQEVEFNHGRTSEGIRERKKINEQLLVKYDGDEEKAKADPEWRQIGQPAGAKLITKKSIAAKEIIRKHSKDFGGTLGDAEVQKLAGIARGSYYRYKKQLKEELMK